jgi:hypothetical protein
MSSPPAGARSVRDFVRRTIGGGAGLVGRFLPLLKYRRDIWARFDNDGVDALRGKFVAVGFRKGFQRKLAGAVNGMIRVS